MTNLVTPYASLAVSEERRAADIVIFGDITSAATGWWSDYYPEDVSAYSLVEQLGGIPEDYEITVHINSNGGEVKEGLAIYNALKARNVTTVIFMAGKRRIMNAASLLFIHQAIVYAEGNPDELEKIAGDLRTITSAAVAAYKEGGVTLSDAELDAKMKAETWITAEDALEWGFATQIATVEVEEGTVTNDAMASVIKAVTRKAPVLGTIEASIDTAPLAAIVDRLEDKLEALDALLKSTKPEPNPAGVENKPFFNFGRKAKED